MIVCRQDVDEARFNPALTPLVHDAKGWIELVDVPTEGILHVSLEAELQVRGVLDLFDVGFV